MNRYFTSGGTSGEPRIVAHGELEWEQIVLDTAFVLKQLGVEYGSSVLIGQPSYPWDIGEVFARAAAICGANVCCLGLALDHPALVREWQKLKPEFIIAPPRKLFHCKPKLKLNRVTLVVVGEAISRVHESHIKRNVGITRVIRVYGHSELGTIAFQASVKSLRLRSNPRLSFTARSGNKLRVRCRYSNRMVETGDVVRIHPPETNATGLWSDSDRLEFVGREASPLAKHGLRVNEAQIESFRRRIGAQTIQVETRTNGKSAVQLLFRIVGAKRFDSAVIGRIAYEHFLDLFDETGGLSTNVGVKFVIEKCSLHDLKATLRGKTPILLVS